MGRGTKPAYSDRYLVSWQTLEMNGELLNRVREAATLGRSFAREMDPMSKNDVRRAIVNKLIEIADEEIVGESVARAAHGSFLNALSCTYLDQYNQLRARGKHTGRALSSSSKAQGLMATTMCSLQTEDANAYRRALTIDESSFAGVRGASAVSAVLRALLSFDDVEVFLPAVEEDLNGVDIIVTHGTSGRGAVLQVKASRDGRTRIAHNFSTARSYGNLFAHDFNEWWEKVQPFTLQHFNVTWHLYMIDAPVDQTPNLDEIGHRLRLPP